MPPIAAIPIDAEIIDISRRRAVAGAHYYYYYYHSFRLNAHCAFIFNLPENLITFCLPHSKVNTHKSNRRGSWKFRKKYFCCRMSSPIRLFSPLASLHRRFLHKAHHEMYGIKIIIIIILWSLWQGLNPAQVRGRVERNFISNQKSTELNWLGESYQSTFMCLRKLHRNRWFVQNEAEQSPQKPGNTLLLIYPLHCGVVWCCIFAAHGNGKSQKINNNIILWLKSGKSHVKAKQSLSTSTIVRVDGGDGAHMCAAATAASLFPARTPSPV